MEQLTAVLYCELLDNIGYVIDFTIINGENGQRSEDRRQQEKTKTVTRKCQLVGE